MAASDDQNLQDNTQNDTELEQYGVWVKTGPEDVDESDADDEAFALSDLGDDELGEDDLLSVDSDLDSLEIDSDDDFDSLSESLDLDDEDEISLDLPASSNLDLGTSDETSEEPDLETLELEAEEPGLADDAAPAADDLLTLEDDDLSFESDDATEELGLDTTIELEVAEPLDAEPMDGIPEHGIDLTEPDEEELESLDLSEPTDEPATEGDAIDIESSLPGDLDDITLDLDSLDVEYDEPTEGLAEAPPDDDDLELPEAPATLPDEEDSLDLDALQDEEDTEVAELDLSLPADDDEFGSLGSEDILEQPEDDLPELEQEDDLALDMGFDDVAAVEDDMASPIGSSSASPGSDDRSLSLLESIERELTSIRAELSGMKEELETLRSAPASSTRTPVDAGTDTAAGFFEDEGDEDEAIALTGDELDNIMNTAEFTEETGQPTVMDEFDSPATMDQSPADLRLDDLDSSLGDAPVQAISLEDSLEEAEPLELSLSDDSETPASFEGSDEEVDALAGMDIDAELADIEELEDDSLPGEVLPALEEEAIEVEEDLLDLEAGPPAGDLEDDELLLGDPATEALTAEEQSLLVGEESLEATLPMEEESAPDEPPAVSSIEETIGQIPTSADAPIPENLRGELRSVLNYMDKLLDSLPEEKIQEFASSDHFKVYRRLFEELGLE